MLSVPLRSLLLPFLVLFPSAVLVRGVAAQERLPNVLLILTDDLGYGDLGCHGSTEIPTPNIDSLARQGVRCTQAYVASPVCAPSRAGLLTGRYPQRFGFECNVATRSPKGETVAPDQGLPPGLKTIAFRMRGAGYATGMVGKWHLGETPSQHPMSRGFDEFFGMLGGNHGYFLEKHALHRGKERIEKPPAPYLTDALGLEATDFIRRHKEHPWFLYVAFQSPHTPLRAKEDDLARFAHIEPENRRIYCAMVSALDRQVGRILATLRETGAEKDTLVLFLNDNGGNVAYNHSLNAPFRGAKGTMLEGGIRVPYLLRWPGVLPANKVYGEAVSSLDIVPTVLAAAKIRTRSEFNSKGKRRRQGWYDGVNLLPFLNGEQEKGRPHETLYWRLAKQAAIRDGDYKLIRLPDRPALLFDVVRDPSEQRDLANDMPGVVRRLYRRLFAWEVELPSPAWTTSVYWAKHNMEFYDREYPLTQPTGSKPPASKAPGGPPAGSKRKRSKRKPKQIGRREPT